MIDTLRWIFWGEWHWIVTTSVSVLIIGIKLLTCLPQTIKSLKKAKKEGLPK